MRRRVLVPAVVLVAVLALLPVLRGGCGRRGERSAAPVAVRAIGPGQILELAEHQDQPWRLRTARDVLPGGLAAAMLPVLIDWTHSEPFADEPFVVLHNLNCGGNPLDGTTVLQSVRVPLDGVESAEFVLVPLGRGGRRAAMHHGQLRLVFRADRPLQLLDAAPPSAGGDVALRDLVFSWEAWRAPGQDYDVVAGMDPDAYRLGLRVYAGPQRFLEDALGGRDWYATPLRLPGGAEGLAELLKVVLVLGDGVSRHTMSELLRESEGAWLARAPAGEDREALARQWDGLKDLARPRDPAADARLDLPASERTYQTVLRSCATLAYYCVTVTVDRLAERGLDDGLRADRLERVQLGGDEPWMREAADASLGGLFVRAPVAVRWLLANPLAVPRNIPGHLDDAGLVQRTDGRPVEHHYALGGDTPYGSLADNLIR